MPLFEFQCAECGTGFEKFVKKREEAGHVVCPACNSNAVHEVLSTFASLLKRVGSGARSGGCKPSG
jgi:putative FmdB family regulatory protein